MIRAIVLAILLWPFGAVAQDFTGLARLDVAQSQVRDRGDGLEVTLHLSQPIPFRLFTLDAPRRLVMDFRELDWQGASRAGLLNADTATDLRFGGFRPGWSRLVVDLAAPLAIESAGMKVDEADGTAVIRARLDPVSEAAFAAAAGAPPDPGWAIGVDDRPALAAPPDESGQDLVVVLDPGHGGIDPGAVQGGVTEADVVLRFSLELYEAMARAGGLRPVLTRRTDVFVPLEQRMTIARAAGADLFLSLHADALASDDTTRGAAVYTLSEEAQDEASARMAERHNRGDLLAGLDLSGQDDTVATVLMDIARLDTGPQSLRLADHLASGLAEAGVRLNSRPRREAPLAVLTAADFASVLIEIGFLSSPQDRAVITSPEGRAQLVSGILDGVQRWDSERRANAPLVRQ